MDRKSLVGKYLSAESKCYGHCSGSTDVKFIEEGERLVACMSCPGGYVSRIIMYGDEVDAGAFREYIISKAGEIGEVTDDDIRVATRHPWDLGAEGPGGGDVSVREAYWTQNYRRTKSEDASRKALFLCGGCGELYVSGIDGAGHEHAPEHGR